MKMCKSGILVERGHGNFSRNLVFIARKHMVDVCERFMSISGGVIDNRLEYIFFLCIVHTRGTSEVEHVQYTACAL